MAVRSSAVGARPWRRRAASARRGLLWLLTAAHLAWSGAAHAAAAAPAATWRLPALGESASDEFSPSQEKRIGDQIMREVRRDPAYLDDPILLDYLQQLWQPLVRVARERGDIGADTAALFPYEAFLVRDRSVNAFALPGGYVGVHLGLLAMTATPDELASVLAHELSHVTQRHIARGVSAQSRASALGMAAMLLGLLVASRASNADMAQAAVMGGQAAVAQSQLNFSRDMEREADRQGFSLLVGAGFAPVGMVSMFDRLDQSGRLNDNGAFPYLRSHPLTTERIGEARQQLEARASVPLPGPPPLLHLLMQTRARVLMDTGVLPTQRLQALDSQARRDDLPASERLAAGLGAALASTALRDFARAEAAARDVLALIATRPPGLDAPAIRAIQHMLAELALARGDAAAARAFLLPLAADRSRPTVLLRAQWALADGSPSALADAAETLHTWLADHRLDAGAWQHLAQVTERSGQVLRSVRAQAEVQAALGDTRGAIDRLRAAQALVQQRGVAPDAFELAVIDARLRELQAQQRQWQAEQREAQRSRRRGDPDEPAPTD